MAESGSPEIAQYSFFPFLERTLSSQKLEVLPLAGDASDRKYYRIIRRNESWVLMKWHPFTDLENYPFLSVQRLFQQNGVQVPGVVALAPEEGLVLLEDLGDLTLERKFWENQNQELVQPFYRQAIDELIKIHHHCSLTQGNFSAFKIQFDVKNLMWELNYTFENLLVQFCALKINEQQKKELFAVFENICYELHEIPKVVCHRDYHSRNLMIKFGKMRVIDFQDARLGPPQYDLVSLLKDSYVDLADEWAEKLIRYYLEERLQLGSAFESLEQFLRGYQIQSIQRCFKACGSFASFYNMRKDRRYLKYLAGTLQKVVASAEVFPHLKVLVSFLREEGVLNRDFESVSES